MSRGSSSSGVSPGAGKGKKSGARAEKLGIAAVTLVLSIAALAVFSAVMRSHDHNEGLYVSAGWLLAHGRELYADFSFWQMPYAAMLYGAVFRIFEPAHYLLTAKLVAYAFWFAAVVLVGLIGWRESRRCFVALGMALLFAINPTVIRCATEASNYIQPIACAMAAYLFAHLAWASDRRARWFWFAAGASSAFAVGFKLYYLPTVAAYLFVLAVFPRAQRVNERARRAFIPFCLGFAVGFAPVIFIAAGNLEAFWFNNLQVHHLTTEWWRETGARYLADGKPFGLPLAWPAKLRFALGIAGEPANAALLLGFAVGVVWWARERAVRAVPVRAASTLPGALAVVSVATVFAPTPMWIQYWGLPIPFLFLWVMQLVLPRTASTPRGTARGVVLFGMVAVALIADGRMMLRNVRLIARVEFWPGIVLSQQARQLSDGIKPRGANDRLAAMQQIWAVESHRFGVMEELAYAPFSYVIADRLTAEQRAAYHIVGPRDLGGLLARKTPAAILAGLYEGLYWPDRDLVDWAQKHGYAEVREVPFGRVFRVVPPRPLSADSR